MIRLLLFACLVLATILMFRSNFAATGYRAQSTIHLAQDDSGLNAQAPEPSTSSDTGNSDDSGKPAENQQ